MRGRSPDTRSAEAFRRAGALRTDDDDGERDDVHVASGRAKALNPHGAGVRERRHADGGTAVRPHDRPAVVRAVQQKLQPEGLVGAGEQILRAGVFARAAAVRTFVDIRMEGMLVLDFVVHAARQPEIGPGPLLALLPKRDVIIADMQIVRVAAGGVAGVPPRLQSAEARLGVRGLGRLIASEVIHDAGLIAQPSGHERHRAGMRFGDALVHVEPHVRVTRRLEDRAGREVERRTAVAGGAGHDYSRSAAISAAWTRAFDATIPRPSSRSRPPSSRETAPPASSTRMLPAAMSQGGSPSSQKASARPADTWAMSTS